MEAYQFKIQIEGAKPPLWRRCLVPVHTNLFQFSYAIQLMFGWSGYHLAAFSKKDGRFRVPVDTPEALEGSEDGMPEHRASETGLADFFGPDPWIHYTYDFGDDWVHRITREGVVADYPYDYPQVIKAQGDDPAEDCGGVDAMNAGHWGEERMPFEAALVNDELEDPLFHAVAPGQQEPDWQELAKEYWGAPDQPDIYWGENDTAYLCTSHYLSSALLNLTKSELMTMAERKGISIRKSLRKDVYCLELSSRMLTDEVLRPRLLWLSKEEMQSLLFILQDVAAPEYLLSIPQDDEENRIFGLPMLRYLGYLDVLEEENAAAIPQDVADAVRHLLTGDFWHEYHRNLWIEAVLLMCGDLYTQLPWTVFLKLVQQMPAFDWDERELLRRIQEVPAEMRQFVYEDGILHLDMPDVCLPNLAPIADDDAYYIPTVEEIWGHDFFDAEGYALYRSFLHCVHEEWPAELRNLMSTMLPTVLYAIVHADSLEPVQDAIQGRLNLRGCGLKNGDALERIYRRDAKRYLSKLREHVRRPEFHGFSQAEQKGSLKASCRQAAKKAPAGWTPKVVPLVDYKRSRK